MTMPVRICSIVDDTTRLSLQALTESSDEPAQPHVIGRPTPWQESELILNHALTAISIVLQINSV
jgi:hypothetical protein